MEVDEENNDNNESEDGPKKVYLPGQNISDENELEFDESAYIMYHEASTGSPCLSFDILRDNLGNDRQDFPMECTTVAGTQARKDRYTNIIVMKMSNLHKTQKTAPDEDKKDDEFDEEEEEDDDESDDEDILPELETAIIKHNGSVNRIRATMVGDKHIIASWSDKGIVYIFDASRPLCAVNDSSVMTTYTLNQESPAPLYSFTGHQTEGFALDWCPTTPGRLATGDCNKNIHVWNPQQGGTWNVDQRPYIGHTDSVEDIQWSPNEANVFASCSVDRSIRVWDTRCAPQKACQVTTKNAHEMDVNVIHWNRNDPFILSGGDDGFLKVWDLRQIKDGKPAALFKHHTSPITSVEWHPTDSSVFSASGADNQITLWDLSLEPDSEAQSSSEMEPDVPPQLLFIHQGQEDMKEIHWHPQIPGLIISTACSGFNIFKTISV